MTVGQTVKVGTFSYGRIVWVGAKGGDWDGYCTVAWGNGHTLELCANLTATGIGG
jgi:hypothetical protein